MNYQYSYIIGDLALFIVWIILFYFRKDLRREMLAISIIFGIGGLFSEIVYMYDWWHPLTITNTPIGIEDFIFGFTIGGISSSIYEFVFNKRIKIKKTNRKGNKERNIRLIKSILLVTLLFVFSFFIIKLHSFYASLIALGLPLLLIWIKRKDLIRESITSGLLLSVIGLIFFIIPETINPGWVNAHWYIQNLSGIKILNAPIEDLIWGIFAGAYIGPLYEYWQEGKLIKAK